MPGLIIPGLRCSSNATPIDTDENGNVGYAMDDIFNSKLLASNAYVGYNNLADPNDGYHDAVNETTPFKKPSISLSERIFEPIGESNSGRSLSVVVEPNFYTLAPEVVSSRSATCPANASLPNKKGGGVVGLLAPLGGASRRPCQTSLLLTSGVGNASEPALTGNDRRVLAATRRRHPAESCNAAVPLSEPRSNLSTGGLLNDFESGDLNDDVSLVMDVFNVASFRHQRHKPNSNDQQSQVQPFEHAGDTYDHRQQLAGLSPLLAKDKDTPSAVKFNDKETPAGSDVDMSSTDYLHDPQNFNASSSNIRDSFSVKDHHNAVQNHYSKTRKRHFTDPVDFEGILRIIGGCGRWQLWIYFLIGLQQIPHAMFNLSVIYMMFKPDHWCYQEWFDSENHDSASSWTAEQVRNITSPLEYDSVHKIWRHSECLMYNRGRDQYHDLSHMAYENASLLAGSANASKMACNKWTYDKTVMESTIVTQWNLVCAENFRRADAQAAYALGYFIGCIISGLSSDRFGRKKTILAFGFLASVFGMILPYTSYFPMFLIVRFLSAVCNEAADLAAYVLCMEITGTQYRSSVGSLLQLPWAIGYTLLALVAFLTRNWRQIQIISAVLHTIAVFFMLILDESPRWLVVNNRVREAEMIIRKACRMNRSDLPADLELVKHAEQRRWVKHNERANLFHLFRSYELVFRSLIIFVIWIATALVYYGISLSLSDQSAPGGKLFSGNFFVNNALAGAVEIPTLIACCFVLRYGRKRCQMVSLILAGFMMLGVCISPDFVYFRFVFMLLGKMFIQAAFIILYIFTSELYPTVIRNSAVGFCSMIARVGSGITGYLALLSDITLPVVPMIIFGIFSLVAGTVVIFLPETIGQPLPETLQDAVVFLKPEKYSYCNFGPFNGLSNRNHKNSECEDVSLTGVIQQQNSSS